jgi:20S proteasome subunit beta 1
MYVYIYVYIHVSIEMGHVVRVKTAAHIMAKICYDNKDNLSAGLIVAGWDPVDGNSVYSIPMGGTCLKVPFAMGGSGSTYIYGLMDSEYQKLADPTLLSEVDARILVKKVISHAMARDGSSGGIIRTVTVSSIVDTSTGITTTTASRDYTNGNELPFGPTGY